MTGKTRTAPRCTGRPTAVSALQSRKILKLTFFCSHPFALPSSFLDKKVEHER